MFCTKCGTNLEEGENFCYACGSSVEPAEDTQNSSLTSKLHNKKLIGGFLLVLFLVCTGLIGVRYYNMNKYDVSVKQIQVTRFPMLYIEIDIEGDPANVLDPKNFIIEENGKKVNIVGFKPTVGDKYLIEFPSNYLKQAGETVNLDVTVVIDGIKHKKSVQYETPMNLPELHTT